MAYERAVATVLAELRRFRSVADLIGCYALDRRAVHAAVVAACADPDPGHVFDLPGGAPVRGDGQRSYGCGSCGAVLFEDLAEPYTVRGIAVRCPVCGKHSRAPES